MEEGSLSVQLRLQRITTEYAYVSIPVTPAILTLEEDGKYHIDWDKMVQQGIEMAAAPGVRWFSESVDIHPHPLQKQPDPGEVDSMS